MCVCVHPLSIACLRLEGSDGVLQLLPELCRHQAFDLQLILLTDMSDLHIHEEGKEREHV